MPAVNRTEERGVRRTGNSDAQSVQLDWATLAGLAIALLGILGGLLLEGGRVSDVSQLTAAFIVVGGTLGAVMVTTPVATLMAALRELPAIFWQPTHSASRTVAQLTALSSKARRKGVVSLEEDLDVIADPFLRKALGLLVDGTDLKVVRRIMELEMDGLEGSGEETARVFEAAGGYAPTIGIIGAVLGLIQVMKHLDDLQAVGHGIAVAFVATVYGVGLANILLLPAANKLKARLHVASRMRELMLEGVIAIGEGLNSQLISSKLDPFLVSLGEKSLAEPSVRKDGVSRSATAA